jgi:SAM-dependent methyltransferase
MRAQETQKMTEATELEAATDPAGRLDELVKRPILDACCGPRMMWFDRQHPAVVYGDKRSETVTVTDRSHGRENGTRTLHIEPDVMMDFRDIPYPDNTFKLVAFDPPHLERAGPKSWMAAKYGKLSDNWREDLRRGFAECFRVLEPDGVLIFKWNETQVKVGEVLALTPVQPLFGHVSGRKGLTHWLVFMNTPTGA